MKHLDLATDGGARGNPGPAGIGAVIRQSTHTVATIKRFLGNATNNVAEYEAVIAALTKARELGADSLTLHLDSELICEQLNLRYKVKHKDLQPRFVKAWNLLQSFQKIKIVHVPREHNKVADRLVNEAIDEGIAAQRNAPLP